jgi:hypothetical protein
MRQQHASNTLAPSVGGRGTGIHAGTAPAIESIHVTCQAVIPRARSWMESIDQHGGA